MPDVRSNDERSLIDAHWRAANHLSIGQICLYDNPLLKQPLSKVHIKPRFLAHWGTTPGLNFIYVHEAGLKRLFKQFSFPRGIPSDVAPETPESIREGGKLGYALSHAYGAAFDNATLVVACVVGEDKAVGEIKRIKLARSEGVAELSVVKSCLAPGSQWLQPPGSGLHRPRRQQGGGHPRLSAAGCQLPTLGHRSLRAQPQIRQRYRLRKATSSAVVEVEHGRGLQALRSRGLASGRDRAATRGIEPDVVMACCGDVPTLETLAAVDLLRRHAPDLRIRVVNVVNLMKLQPKNEHPNGLPDSEFHALFTTDKPVVFAFHGYPWLIHRLTDRRKGHNNFHLRADGTLRRSAKKAA